MVPIPSEDLQLHRKAWLARHLGRLISGIRARRRQQLQHQKLKAIAGVRNIVIGSSGTGFDGWVSTDQDVLDLLNPATWARYFPSSSVDAILAEHVWEHLTANEAIVAARTCFTFLKPGGYLRAAVPDGYHPDPRYIGMVRPGGTGAGAHDHKVLYTITSFSDLFETAGFDVVPLEFFDKEGRFNYRDWDPSEGMIRRSSRFDPRNSPGERSYTSIIIDAVKPHAKLF